ANTGRRVGLSSDTPAGFAHFPSASSLPSLDRSYSTGPRHRGPDDPRRRVPRRHPRPPRRRRPAADLRRLADRPRRTVRRGSGRADPRAVLAGVPARRLPPAEPLGGGGGPAAALARVALAAARVAFAGPGQLAARLLRGPHP